MSGFELQHSSPGILTSNGSSFADVQYVGITDNLAVVQSGRVDDATVYFGISTYADWSTPNQVAFDIYIDTDDDGLSDYRLFNSDAKNYLGSNQVSDSFVAVIEDLRTGQYSKPQLLNVRSSNEVDTNLFNTNIMILPVDAVDIGLSNADTDFSYRIHSVNRVSGVFVETTPLLQYDLTAKVIDLFSHNERAPIFDDRDGAAIGIQLDSDNVTVSGDSPNLLLLHHHNRSGDRAEIIEVRYEWPFKNYLPVIGAQE